VLNAAASLAAGTATPARLVVELNRALYEDEQARAPGVGVAALRSARFSPDETRTQLAALVERGELSSDEAKSVAASADYVRKLQQTYVLRDLARDTAGFDPSAPMVYEPLTWFPSGQPGTRESLATAWRTAAELASTVQRPVLLVFGGHEYQIEPGAARTYSKATLRAAEERAELSMEAAKVVGNGVKQAGFGWNMSSDLQLFATRFAAWHVQRATSPDYLALDRAVAERAGERLAPLARETLVKNVPDPIRALAALADGQPVDLQSQPGQVRYDLIQEARSYADALDTAVRVSHGQTTYLVQPARVEAAPAYAREKRLVFLAGLAKAHGRENAVEIAQRILTEAELASASSPDTTNFDPGRELKARWGGWMTGKAEDAGIGSVASAYALAAPTSEVFFIAPRDWQGGSAVLDYVRDRGF
jgi:hypothetical protein